MGITLKSNEEALRAAIFVRMEKIRKAFSDGRIGEDVQPLITEAGERAHKLHMLLKNRDLEPKHHKYMIDNRQLQPDDEQFYMHFHPIEDLLKFLENENANDDPEDQTIGSEFEFRVFSRRFEHDDTYTVKRTVDGWDIRHIDSGGPCDKGGRPFLFDYLRHDSIQFPEGLDGWMEWLWMKAAEEGMSKEEVQAAIQQLADWVTTTERSSPNGGVWNGY